MELLEIGKTITGEVIKELEIKIKMEFPTEYKMFLEKNNGGMPEDDVAFHFIEKDTITQQTWEQGSDIHYFYNIDEMLEAYENLVGESIIPKDYMPIACDSFGNDILICLNKKKNYGEIFFANHEIENVDNAFGNISFVTHSFGEFFRILEIAALEIKMDIKLPDDYKGFLMKNNGVVPERRLIFSFCEIDPENGEKYDMKTDVQNFSSISEIPFFYENLVGAGVIPEKYLSIACDSCGNEILLCVNESENYGKIFFGNHEVYQTGTNYFNLSFVADSFEDFCTMLYEG